MLPSLSSYSQDKKVPRDSQEAQNYFALHPELSSKPAPSSPSKPASSDPTTSSLDALFGPETTPTNTSTPTSAEPSNPPESAAPPPRPAASAPKRKKAGGGGLGAMAASLGVGSKPAKLNTLEKSKLDWNSYVSLSISHIYCSLAIREADMLSVLSSVGTYKLKMGWKTLCNTLGKMGTLRRKISWTGSR